MNLTIKKSFYVLIMINVFLFILLSLNIFAIYSNNKKLKELEYCKNLMMEKSFELRNSINDLSRLVRTYVVTNEKKYRDDYYKVLDIRSGKAPRPQNYHYIYWDLLEPLRSQRHPLEDKISLSEEIRLLPFSKEALNKLHLAEHNSDKLVALEVKAMKMAEGEFTDANRERALSLLYSLEYHKVKENSMIPIDEFLFLVNQYTQKEINKYSKLLDKNIFTLCVLFMVYILMFIRSYMFLKLRILDPLSLLSRCIHKYEDGEKDFDIMITNDEDEVGTVLREFRHMKNNLNEKYELIEKMSITDDLTATYNRKYYNEKIAELLSIFKRYGTKFSILIYDIDDFKFINDTYGHAVGDTVLIQMSVLVKGLIRDSDYLFRIGGEEFVVLLPETNLEEAMSVGDKIRESIEASEIVDNELITVSLGVTDVYEDDSVDSLFQRVDELLYNAKRKGKNQVSSSRTV